MGAEGGDGAAEALGKTFGGGGPREGVGGALDAEGAEEGEEFGGRAGPSRLVLDQEADGMGDGVGDWGFAGRGEGGEDGVLGGAEGWGGGEGPGGGIGQAGRGVEGDGSPAAESGAEGGREGGEEAGMGGFEVALEIGLGAAMFGWDGRQVDGEGPVGEIRGRGPAGLAGGVGGYGEKDGALEGELEGLAVVPAFVEGEAGAGGETAEGVGDGVADCGDVIESQDAVVVGQGEQLALGGGEGGEGGRGGVDQKAEQAGGGGFAGAGGALEDEDRIRAGGREGGEEPGEAAQPVLGVWEVEEGAERGEVGGGVLVGTREGEGAAAVAEAEVSSGGDFPAFGADADDFALGVGQVEKDGFGGLVFGLAGGGDALLDGLEDAAAVGAGLDGAEGLAEGGIARGKLELAVETMEEPVAEACGADGPDLLAGAEREANEGLAVLGGEGGGRGGAVQEELEFAGLVGFGRMT